MLATSRCGGHGAENFTDTTGGGEPSPSESPGPSGAPVLIEFVAPDSTSGTAASDGSTVFQSSIGPVGSSNPQGSFVQFRLLNSDGRPAKNGIRVVFSVEGPSDAKLTQTKDRTSNGFVGVVLQAGPTAGGAVVVAKVDGTSLVARSAVITIGSPPGAAASIEFFGLRVPGLIGSADDNAGTPTTRTQLGVKGSGFAQAVDVVFAVLDTHGGAAADGTIVDFNLFGPNGGETIAPTSVLSSKGFVSATITTGTRPGPVEITATVRGTSLSARAIPITIGTALNPAASHLSIAPECLNVAGSVTFGLEDRLRAGLSDQFGNPIPIGSAVSFFAEGGGVIAQGLTGDSLAAFAQLVTQLPIPGDERVQVLAVTTGQETFTDLNGNGTWDPGEPFVDQPPEVFLDANENGVYDPGEFFVDNNNNGIYDGTPNGIWDDQILISAQAPVIFSGHSDITVVTDPPTFFLDFGQTSTLDVIISDEIGAALVGTTTVTVAGTNVTVIPTSFGIPDTSIFSSFDAPVPGITEFTIVISNPNQPPAPQPVPSGGTPVPEATPTMQLATVTISVTSDVSTGTDVTCPGGNGNIFLTIFGSVAK
ncbi:MAG TPA: hypothetical protein VGK30_09230 [Candidatus Binatia bacterium]